MRNPGASTVKGPSLLGLLAALHLSLQPLQAQSPPAPSLHPLFASDQVISLRLAFTRAAWDSLVPADNPGFGPDRGPRPGPPPKTDYPWSTCIFTADGNSLPGVAIRFKGNSSYRMSQAGWKRPFRIDFNRKAKGRTWRGVEELSLNNNRNDATQIREALAYQLFREAGLPAPRTAFAQVHLTIEGHDGELHAGLYTLVEPVEEEFLLDRFGTKKGLLLKPERLRGLEYLGDSWAPYEVRYQPKSKVLPVEADRFMALTRLIAESPEETFTQTLPRALDLDGFLRYLALTAWLANLDSFLGTGHNYYLFQPAGDAQATMIPWDLNESFGGHPPGGPRRRQAEFSVLHPNGTPNRLIDRVLAIPAFATRYRAELERLQAGPCSPEHLLPIAERWALRVRSAAEAESPGAASAFRRAALGEADEENPTPVPPANRGWNRGPGASEDGSLADWIRLRHRNVAEELAGTRQAEPPRLRNGPGPGPGPDGRPRGPRLGGPGGLVPPPRR